jgi:hypothetical protein
MQNPWTRLPECEPYVLRDDRELIEQFNVDAAEAHRVRLDLVPEPYLGRPDAPIVLLNLNPGAGEQRASPEALAHSSPEFRRRSFSSLRHESRPYPFYLLDPAVKMPGNAWWTQKLKWWIRDTSLLDVASHVACVELHPYHSLRYSHRMPRVPSQEYSFELVRRALHRGAHIVFMRARRQWLSVIPELAAYAHVSELSSKQNVCLSPRNLGDRYEVLLEALRNAS